jgi:hypothetical protein
MQQAHREVQQRLTARLVISPAANGTAAAVTEERERQHAYCCCRIDTLLHCTWSICSNGDQESVQEGVHIGVQLNKLLQEMPVCTIQVGSLKPSPVITI